MNKMLIAAAATASLLLFAAAAAAAAAHAQAPAAATATCKDGTGWSGTSHMGACSRHGGVASFGQPAPTTGSAAVAPAPGALMPAAAAPAAPVAAAVSALAGPNMSCPGDKVVWVNIPTHVYHFHGERYFGKTASGKYTCQKAADAEGDRSTHNGQ